MQGIRLKNVTQLGEALKLAPELIEDFDDWLEEQLEQKAYTEWEISRGKMIFAVLFLNSFCKMNNRVKQLSCM